jgi:hypothetical protein
MTATEAVDLFSFDTRRHRVVEWQAPGPVAKAASGMSGLETMCAIRDGILPPPPMARLIGFEMRIAEPGRIVMELDPDESSEIPSDYCMARPQRRCWIPPWVARLPPCSRRGRRR